MGARSLHARFMLVGWIIVLGSVILLRACAHSPSPQPEASVTLSSTPTEPPLLQVSGLSMNQTNIIVAVDRSRSMDALWDGWRDDVQDILSRVLGKSGEFQLILYPAEEKGMTIEPVSIASPSNLPSMIETSGQAQNGYLDALDVISDNIEVEAQNIVIWVTDGSFHYENGRRDASEAERQSGRFEDNFEITYGVWEKNNYSISIYVFGHIDEDQRVGEDRQYDRDWDAWFSWERKGWLSQVKFYEKDEERSIMEDVENILQYLCPRGTFEISYDNHNNTLLCHDGIGNEVNCSPYFTVTRNSTVEGYASSFEVFVCGTPLVTVQWNVDSQSWECRKEEIETAIVSIEVAEGWDLQNLYDNREFRVLDGPSCAQAIAGEYQDQCAEAPEPYTDTESHVFKRLQEGVCAQGDEGVCYKIEYEDDREMRIAVPMDIVEQCAFEVQIDNNQATMSLLLKRLFEGEENGR